MTAPRRADRDNVRSLRLERASHGITELRRAAGEAEREFHGELASVAPGNRESARNLVHYLAVRGHDLRDLQNDLAQLGLSSLGRMEAHVMASLVAVEQVLATLRGRDVPAELADLPCLSFASGDALLDEHAQSVLGASLPGLGTRVMVTMPGEAADDAGLIRRLLEAGMGIMRINCAHDDEPTWTRMLAHLRNAELETGRRCLVSFDVAGPKLRTGPIRPGPAVMKWRPRRDALGRVVARARIRLTAQITADDHEHDEPTVPVTPELVAAARRGDTIAFFDARHRKRSLEVVATQPQALVCETESTAYVTPGVRLELCHGSRVVGHGEVLEVPQREQWIELRLGDALQLFLGDAPGHDVEHGEEGEVLAPAAIGCALPEVFAASRIGDPVLFDDGKVRGVIRGVAHERLDIEVTGVAGKVAKLRAEKGINLPNTDLGLPALTPADLAHLDFVARHADLVAMSFVQRAADVQALIQALAARDARHLAIVLKIETRAGFDRLPELLLAAMRHDRVAVMVARGDLGVEVGFERLSEVQEEILWLCEAAHVPVIWATQVLESLAKGGMPSRAEVTDAAMSSRAECVMLNKGPYIVETLRFLLDVLARMEEHQHKKSALLRRLRVSGTRAARARTHQRLGIGAD